MCQIECHAVGIKSKPETKAGSSRRMALRYPCRGTADGEPGTENSALEGRRERCSLQVVPSGNRMTAPGDSSHLWGVVMGEAFGGWLSSSCVSAQALESGFPAAS